MAKKYNFQLLIIVFFLLGCEKKSSSIVDSVGTAPLLTEPKSSLTTVNTDTINIGDIRKPEDILTLQSQLTVRATHAEGRTKIRAVHFSVKDVENLTIVEGLLKDDGQSSDIKANDSVYSAIFYFQINRVVIGTYHIIIWSESVDEYMSNTVIEPIHIVRSNHSPVILNLQAADTLYRNSTLKLTLQVSDSDGLADIYSVGFITLKPDGKYANNGNLIPMLDDGNVNQTSGDALAKDGVYTYTYVVPNNDDVLGTYTYTFYAIDRSRVSSDSLIHRIVIR